MSNFCHPENPGSSHWLGCACSESAWAEKLAAAEERAKASDMALQSLTPGGSEFVNDPQACVRFVRDFRDGQHAQILKLTRERRAAEERARRLEEALRAEALLLAAAAGIQAVAEEAGRTTKASEVYQYLAFRLALLAPPPEAEKRGEG